jgi:hypothetical protein
LGEEIADSSRRHRDCDIAGMIERRIPSHAPRKLLAREEAQSKGRDGRAEHIAYDGHEAVGDRHRPEGRQRKDDDRRCGQRDQREDNRAPLRTRLVDGRANWGLDRKYCSLTAPPDRRERSGVPVE